MRCGCGSPRQAPLSWTGRYAAERGWAGMDWGVGLPGTIGGATVNNAGRTWTEQIDHLRASRRADVSEARVVEQPAAWLRGRLPAHDHQGSAAAAALDRAGGRSCCSER